MCATAHFLAPLACAAWLLAAAPASAQDGPPPGPPPEAVAACSGKAEGDAVTVVLPDGKSLAATCRTMRDGQLAARPDHPPGGHPPPR